VIGMVATTHPGTISVTTIPRVSIKVFGTVPSSWLTSWLASESSSFAEAMGER